MCAAPAEIKKRRAAAPKPQVRVVAPSHLETKRYWRFTLWQWIGLALLLAASFLRLFALSDKVLHHDEGVNGMFITNLFRTGYYHYDPANYHGPSLFYISEITTTIGSVFLGKGGLNTFTVRLVTAIFGIGVVWLLLCLRRQLGLFGSLAAAAMAAVSPGLVFFSRYYIHEILFVFFSLGVIVAWLRYGETGLPRCFMLATASLAMMGTTKETWVITLAVWLIAIPCTMLWLRIVKSDELEPVVAATDGAGETRWTRQQLYTNAAILFLAVWVVLYSSLFTNFPQGVADSFLTYKHWFETSGNANVYPWTKYLEWLLGLADGRASLRADAELPAMLFGAFGIIVALLQARSRFAVFTAFWSMGVLAAYCLIPYKTPWLALSIVLPFVMMAGYGLEQLYTRWRQRAVALALTVLWLGLGVTQAWDLSFKSFDDERQPYSYAHTRGDFLNLVKEVENIASGNPAGKTIGITIMSPEHWPLPWYLRDYPNAGFWGRIVDTKEAMIIAHQDQKAEVDRLLGDKYRVISQHDLRPGNTLVLYLRKDLQP
jgi:uncharacterized protein (TIGR03663 family)